MLLASSVWEPASRTRQRWKKSAKAKTVTGAKGRRGDAGAVFDLAPNLGSVADKRAAYGGVIGGRENGADKLPKHLPPGRAVSVSKQCPKKVRETGQRTGRWISTQSVNTRNLAEWEKAETGRAVANFEDGMKATKLC